MTDMLTLPVEANAFESASPQTHRRVPLFVPRGQLYYWSNVWQAGEGEALSDLASGKHRTFPHGSAAAAWLLSDDDDEA